jgi:Nidogen-like
MGDKVIIQNKKTMEENSMNQAKMPCASIVGGSNGVRKVNLRNQFKSVKLIWSILIIAVTISLMPHAKAGAIRSGFDANTLPSDPSDPSGGQGDDGSSDFVPFPTGFSVNIFGGNYDGLYVNVNGSVTFDGPLSGYIPGPIIGAGMKIIAPFWADVDTRPIASGKVTYGTGTVNGLTAFGVNWINVGYYKNKVDKLNSFQLVIYPAPACGTLAADNYVIEFNYDMVGWDTGDVSQGESARAGFSDGDQISYEMNGSGVSGAFLDSSSTGLIYDRTSASDPFGRYRFVFLGGILGCRPHAPHLLTATADVNGIALAWDHVDCTDSYLIKRSETEDGPYTVIETVANSANPSYLDKNVADGTRYYYMVMAQGICDENASLDSNEASAVADIDPATLGAGAFSGSDFQFTITGPSGALVGVKATEDFVTWTSLGEVTLNGGTHNFTDTSVGSKTHRFYNAKHLNVCSLNTSGFIKVTVPGKTGSAQYGAAFIANQLNNPAGNTIDNVTRVNVPDGTMVWKFSVANQTWENPCTFFGPPDNIWDPMIFLNPGEGALVNNPSTDPLTFIFVGDVPQGAQINGNVPSTGGKYSYISSIVPRSAGLDVLTFPAVDGDFIYRWDKNAQSWGSHPCSFYGSPDNIWDPAVPTPGVGEAFLLLTGGIHSQWTENFSAAPQ